LHARAAGLRRILLAIVEIARRWSGLVPSSPVSDELPAANGALVHSLAEARLSADAL